MSLPHEHRTPLCVDRQPTGFDVPDDPLLAGADSPKDRLDPDDQFPWRERLDDVVVGSELEARDAVGFLASGREQDDWEFALGTDPAAEVQPAALRDHDVEDHQIRAIHLDRPTRRQAVGRFERLETFVVQVAHDDVAHDVLVVNDEHPWRATHLAGNPGISEAASAIRKTVATSRPGACRPGLQKPYASGARRGGSFEVAFL